MSEDAYDKLREAICNKEAKARRYGGYYLCDHISVSTDFYRQLLANKNHIRQNSSRVSDHSVYSFKIRPVSGQKEPFIFHD